MKLTPKSQKYVDLETQYGAHNYAPLPVVLERGQGARVWDVDGKEYIDFLSMIAVNNMGHGHPKIIKATIEALNMGATINLAFQSPFYGKLAKRLHEVS